MTLHVNLSLGAMSDVLFKYIFSDPNDSNSQFLLCTLISEVTGSPIHSLTIKNSEKIADHFDDKLVRFDIKCETDCHHFYDIEMQASRLYKETIKRFGYYGAILIDENIDKGEVYRMINHNVLIILVNDINKDHPCLIEEYESRTHHGHREYLIKEPDDAILTKYFVYIPFIDKINKDIQEFTDLELMIYILKHGIDQRMKQLKNRKVVKAMETRINHFSMDKMARIQEKERIVLLKTQQAIEEEIREQGLEQGLEQGHRQGILNTVKRMISNKIGQLTQETTLLLKRSSIEELNHLIDNFDTIHREQDIISLLK